MHEADGIVSSSLEAYVINGEGDSMQQGIGLQNERVIILGGSSGIGLAVAEQASSQGADVVIVS
jgi:NADPH:quinone reductase-like Zn-dependent oxidoreductase